MEVLLLSGPDLQSIGMTFADAAKCCDDAFQAHGKKHYEMPPKPGVHSLGNSFIHAMPGYMAPKGSGEEAAIGIKWIAGYPDNGKNRKPVITGLMVLNDPQTGYVKAAMDGAFVTNIRTAGATAASYPKFGRPSVDTSIGLVGCGMQGKWNVVALSGLMNLKKVKAYDVFPAAIESFKKVIEENCPGVEVEAVGSEQECVTDVDVILTATVAADKPFLFCDWVKKGATIFPIHAKGWDNDAAGKVDKFVVDDIPQFKSLTGGWYSANETFHGETGEVLAAAKPGRENDDEKIMVINTGLGLHDLTTATRLLQMKEEKGLDIGIKWQCFPEGPPSSAVPKVK